MPSYSVLMSVYHREEPENLKEAMESIWKQSIPTDDFVLICDGPLTPALDLVIEEMQHRFPKRLRVHRLEKNGGLGNALNIGVRLCRNELIARMDSDDISRPDRCERQLAAFEEDPELSIVSGTVEEFNESRERIDSRRVLPETTEEILAFAKKRNPFNHPCVMYKKSAVEAAGGYQDFYLLEDYFLWLRMLRMGCRGRNLPEPLLWMRAGSGMYRRRSGWKYARSQRRLFQYMLHNGFINPAQYASSVLIRTAASLIPNEARELGYRLFLRKEKKRREMEYE